INQLFCIHCRRFRAWRMMNFRQRMGWIGVGLYLIASAAAFYYVFEINETYNRLALERRNHLGALLKNMAAVRTLLAVDYYLLDPLFANVPVPLIPVTRADPQMVGYCIIPLCLAVVCKRHQTFVKASNQISRLQLTDNLNPSVSQ
uniref:Lysosomal enzyme trafficking factor n=1 Tax=Podarcis muralis TaxID=64176 RepID=A0A670K4L3_PODMU